MSALLLGFVISVVLRESVFDDADGNVTLIGNIAALAIGFGVSALIITVVWATRRGR